MKAKKLCPTGTKIQTLIFSKDYFSEKTAKDWAKKHDLNYGKVDEKENTLRLRQENPSDFKKGTFRSIDLTDGVKAVIACPVKKYDDGGDIDVNNACVEETIGLIDSYLAIADWFIVGSDLIIVFKDELYSDDVTEINQILKKFEICHDVILPEVIINYGESYKSIKLKLINNNVSLNKYDNGGGVDEGIDLFEDYENIPDNVRRILNEYELEDNDYKELAELQSRLEEIGYTFDYGLDAEPYGLRPVTQSEYDSERFEDGGAIGEILNKTDLSDSVKEKLLTSLTQAGYSELDSFIDEDIPQALPVKQKIWVTTKKIKETIGCTYQQANSIAEVVYGLLDSKPEVKAEEVVEEVVETTRPTNEMWQSIKNKFGEVYFIEDSDDNELVSDQVKAEEYVWQFDRYSNYASPLSWADAEYKFKKSLTAEELDSIEISYKKEKYADSEEHDTEKFYKQIFVRRKKETPIPVAPIETPIEIAESVVQDEVQSIREAIEYLQMEAESGDSDAIEALEYLRTELESVVSNLNPEKINAFIYRPTGDYIKAGENQSMKVYYDGDSKIITKIELWEDGNKIKSWSGSEVGSVFSDDIEIERMDNGGEILIGGNADYMSLDDIAEMHNVSLEHILRQAKIGKKVEREHTSNQNKIIEIVKDHLYENPDYYTKLQKIESSFDNGGQTGYYLDVPSSLNGMFGVLSLSQTKGGVFGILQDNGFYRYNYLNERDLDTAIAILIRLQNPNYAKNMPMNLNQLKEYIQVGRILRVSYNRNRPNRVGAVNIVVKVQTNGFWLLDGTTLPSELDLDLKKAIWFEYPKANMISFSPMGFTLYMKDSNQNVFKYLQYEYIVGDSVDVAMNEEEVKVNYTPIEPKRLKFGGITPDMIKNGFDYNFDNISVSCFINAKDTGRTLMLRRSEGDYLGTWCLISGGMEANELPSETIKREIQEELGVQLDFSNLIYIAKTKHPHGTHYYYEMSVNEEFEPKLNAENDAYVWTSMFDLPSNLHPLLNKYLKSEVYAL